MKLTFENEEMNTPEWQGRLGKYSEDFVDVINSLKATPDLITLRNLRFLQFIEIEQSPSNVLFSVLVSGNLKLIVNQYGNNGEAILNVVKLENGK